MLRTNYTVGVDRMVNYINGVVCSGTHNSSMADILVSPSCLDLFHEQIKRHTSVKVYIPSCFVNGDM